MEEEYLHYDPYCTVCGGCGEEECCSPLHCKHSEDGKFCETYLKDLKFGYEMNKFFQTNICDKISQELQDQYWETWDKVFDKYNKNFNYKQSKL